MVALSWADRLARLCLSEEQIIEDPAGALAEYRADVPGVETKLIAGSGHSPNVEKPAETAGLILGFAKTPQSVVRSAARDAVERGSSPQRSSSGSSRNRASGVRSATGDQ